MPDRRQHRGPHPQDAELFAPALVPVLRAAVAELSWLLSRGYADVAAAKLVGDRHRLLQRQRIAVRRCACSDEQKARRAQRRQGLMACAGAALAVDGFNLLTTIEAALAGGVLLRGRDGWVRDMASMHGSWKRVAETAAAVEILCDVLAAATPSAVTVVLDRPVKNSGRLAVLVRAAAAARGLSWQVLLSAHADRELLDVGAVVATADSAVLDRAARHLDVVGAALPRLVSSRSLGATWLLDLGD